MLPEEQEAVSLYEIRGPWFQLQDSLPRTIYLKNDRKLSIIQRRKSQDPQRSQSTQRLGFYS